MLSVRQSCLALFFFATEEENYSLQRFCNTLNNKKKVTRITKSRFFCRPITRYKHTHTHAFPLQILTKTLAIRYTNKSQILILMYDL